MILFSILSQAQSQKNELICRERSGTFKEVKTYFQGPYLSSSFFINSLNINNSVEVPIRVRIEPRKSTDRVDGVEISANGWHLEYNIGQTRNCKFYFMTPEDVIDYQKHSPNLASRFSANLTTDCGLRGKESKVLLCQFR